MRITGGNKGGTEFERVPAGDFVKGKILDVEEEVSHTFRGFEGNPDTVAPALRFVFELEGCQHKHYSNWMKASTHKKSGFYSKYLQSLVEGAVPFMDFETKELIGLKVKVIWNDKDWQGIDMIKPLDKKIPSKGAEETQIPF